MNWRTEWNTLSDRIRGHENALALFVSGQKLMSSDGYAMKRKLLAPAARAIYAAAKEFRERHGSSLPVGAASAIDRFSTDYGDLLGNTELDNIEHTMACGVILAGLRAELDYQLAEPSAVLLRVSERALEHLQRSLVVDAQLAARWRQAFEVGEVACERLGAVHLLQHGIWAFKISAEGERTDLVYGEPLGGLSEAAAGADAIVLTEWKVVRSQSELSSKLEGARQQIQRYSQGVLGGIELADSRFVVLVSADHLALPPDEISDSVTLRYRNIAVQPSTPSKRVRRDASRRELVQPAGPR